jgi:hypothetical protein
MNAETASLPQGGYGNRCLSESPDLESSGSAC